MRLIEFIEDCANQFEGAQLCYGHGTDNAGDEAIWLCCYALGIKPHQIEDSWDRGLSTDEIKQLKDLIEQRIEQRIPTAYLLGKAWFAGLEFIVNSDVLIPRSPIAELIYKKYQPWLKEKTNYQILDLCTGSGCIGLASAYHLSNVNVDCADISEQALAVAKQNQAKLGLENRTELIQSDLFKSIPQKKYDLIVTNPPYVDAPDLAGMPAEFHHEPRLGLEAGDDGLRLVHEILQEAGNYLADDGVLIVEVGNSQVHVDAAYPDLPIVWLEFEYGGHGVFLIEKQHLS